MSPHARWMAADGGTLDGRCRSCGSPVGSYDPETEVVECEGCGTPWPSDDWRADP